MENCVRIKISKTQVALSSRENLIRFASVNARSLKNKSAEFVDHILGNNIDICVVTETWLKDIDSVSIAALSPAGHHLKRFPRQSDRRGGGTGVMCSSRIKINFINGDEKHSFEYSEWNCKVSNKAIKIIAVYRPPYSQSHAVTSNMFFEEFSSFLESIVMCPEILLITGDFNFHLDDIADEDSRKFIEVLETFGLIQHVKFPTHISNHILDLIITRSSSDVIIGEIQASFFPSDHCFVECSLSVPRPNPRQKKLQFRKMRQINIDAFKSDIVTSNLCNERPPLMKLRLI